MPSFARIRELITFVLQSVFVVPVAFLSIIVPKKKGLLIFGSGKQMRFVGNTKYLFLYASKERREFTSVFLTKRKDVHDQLVSVGSQSETGFFRKLWFLLRAEYVFIETTLIDVSPFFFLPGNFKIINLWHGTPLKKIESDARKVSNAYRLATAFNNSHYYKIIAAGDEGAEHMKSAFKNDNCIITGFPRNDIFFWDTDSQLKIISRLDALLGIKQYSRVVLYAPTFRDNYELTPFTNSDLASLNLFCSIHNVLFLIKEHPNRQSISLKENFSNIMQVSMIVDDAQELLLVSDLLITDYSSIFFDYSLSGKPILFYCYDLQKYIDLNRDMYYVYKDVAPPIAQCKSFNYLLNALQEHVLNSHIEHDYVDYIKNRFNKFASGGYCERVLSIL